MTTRRRAFALALVALLSFAATPARAAPADPAVRQVWRLGARLASADGHRFWVSADFFRYAESRNLVLYPAEISIVDERAERHYTDRRIERSAFDGTQRTGFGMAIHAGDWSIAQTQSAGGIATFDLNARTRGAVLHLHQVARKSPVAYDFGGGPHRAYTWLDCTGTIVIAGTTYALAGKGWLDRGVAADAVAPASGVRGSFVLQLDDRREIVVGNDGPSARRAVPHAFMVRADGSVERLERGRYAFVGHNVWHSKHTPNDYPDQWGLAVFGETQDLLFEPIVLDQESPAYGAGATFYESAFDVFDNTPGSMGARLGSAFGMLAGFGNPGAMR